MALDLKGRQFGALQDALLDAFPSWNELDQLVQFELSENLEELAGKGRLGDVAFELIKWARSRSRLDELLAGAMRRNPTNVSLRSLGIELSLSSDEPPSSSLEALVMPEVAFANAAEWRSRMARAERCICRIEFADSAGTWRAVGTGSLVAADVVLTNAHVVASIGGKPARAQFDYAYDAAGVAQPGYTAPLLQMTLASSDPDQLDFALLRAGERVGDLHAADGQRRGWLSLAPHTFTSGEPIFILQHPGADRLKLGVGVVSDVQPAPPRVRYTANTLPGSSGSPCFTLDWSLVALHHAGEAKANRGIPAAAIAAQLAAAGQRDLLGKASHVFLSYRREGDEAALAERVRQRLEAAGHSVFIDTAMKIGTEWAKEIASNIARCDAFVVFLSEQSIAREMVQMEVRQAHQRRQVDGRPLLLPVRVRYDGPLDNDMHTFLGHLQYVTWQGPPDDDRVLAHILRAIDERRDPEPRTPVPEAIASAPSSGTAAARPLPDMDPRVLSMPGGSVLLDDPLYVRRDADAKVVPLSPLDGATLVIRGARQQGKSTLLMRYLDACQSRAKEVAFVTLQSLSQVALADYGAFLRELAAELAHGLGLKADVSSITSKPSFSWFIEEHVIKAVDAPLVLAFDELDLISDCAYKTDFYGLLRAWHEKRNNPAKANRIWRRVGLAMVISTEPRFLITDPRQSPFNVGNQLEVGNFSVDECVALNRQSGGVISAADIPRLHVLLGGHPYLTRLAFYYALTGTPASLEAAKVATSHGPYGDHLRTLVTKLAMAPDVLAALKDLIQSGKRPPPAMVERLRSVGLVRVDGEKVLVANELYAAFVPTIR